MVEGWTSPGPDEVQEVLPAVIHLAQLALYLAGLALVAGPGQPLAQPVQLQLVVLHQGDLLLVVLATTHNQPIRNE